MDAMMVLDCENTVPNRFALVVAAAGGCALSRSAEPRLTSDVTVPVELARSMIRPEAEGNEFRDILPGPEAQPRKFEKLPSTPVKHEL
jgi:hypothetical protein